MLLIQSINFSTDGSSICSALNFGHWMIANSARRGNISAPHACSQTSRLCIYEKVSFSSEGNVQSWP
uniref:Uncharacterized protein n=1 Tax=Arundo donax TaxID=35708 RepID=A0A0A9A1T0_ARUDO